MDTGKKRSREKEEKRREKKSIFSTRSRSSLCRHSENEGESRLTGTHFRSRNSVHEGMLVSGILRNGKMCDRLANKRDE